MTDRRTDGQTDRQTDRRRAGRIIWRLRSGDAAHVVPEGVRRGPPARTRAGGARLLGLVFIKDEPERLCCSVPHIK